MKFKKPVVICVSKKELDEYVMASASCNNALCKQGHTYTCNVSSAYSCQSVLYKGVVCIVGNSFSCGTAVSHTDVFDDWGEIS